MTRKTQLYFATALSSLITGSTAFADVTALQVWDDWQALIGRTGGEVQFEQSVSDGILTINDLVLNLNGDGVLQGTVINLGSLAMQDQGNGTVKVLLPNGSKIGVSNSGHQIKLTHDYEGLTFIISGSQDALSYDFNAAKLSLTLSELMDTGQKIDGPTANISIKDISLSTHQTDAELFNVEQAISISEMSYNIDVHFPDRFISLKTKGNTSGLKGSLSAKIPRYKRAEIVNEVRQIALDWLTSEDEYNFISLILKKDHYTKTLISEALNNGLSLSARFETQKVDVDIDYESGGFKPSSYLIFTSPKISIDMSRDRFNLDEIVDGIELGIYGVLEGIGNLDYATTEFTKRIDIPIGISQNPAPFSYHVGSIDMTVGEPIWNLLGDGGMLPRDPINLVLDVSGLGNWLTDPFLIEPTDDEADLVPPTDDTGYLHSLDINDFQLSAIGANVSAVGGFTFDNDKRVTYSGYLGDILGNIPAPTGSLDIKLEGLNKLIETLSEMYLLDEDTAEVVHIWLAAFTVAEGGDDTLISHIETTDDGHVLANGKRLK